MLIDFHFGSFSGGCKSLDRRWIHVTAIRITASVGTFSRIVSYPEYASERR